MERVTAVHSRHFVQMGFEAEVEKSINNVKGKVQVELNGERKLAF